MAAPTSREDRRTRGMHASLTTQPENEMSRR
jgi:hypothetical protein